MSHRTIQEATENAQIVAFGHFGRGVQLEGRALSARAAAETPTARLAATWRAQYSAEWERLACEDAEAAEKCGEHKQVGADKPRCEHAHVANYAGAVSWCAYCGSVNAGGEWFAPAVWRDAVLVR